MFSCCDVIPRRTLDQRLIRCQVSESELKTLQQSFEIGRSLVRVTPGLLLDGIEDTLFSPRYAQPEPIHVRRCL